MDLDYEPTSKCLISGLPIKGEIRTNPSNNQDIYWYYVDLPDKMKSVALCRSLYNNLWSDESEASQLVKQNKVLLTAELINGDSFQKVNIHAEFCTMKTQKDIKLSDFVNELVKNRKLPKTRKDKYDHLVNFLNKSQPFEGGEIQISNSLGFYGQLYFTSFDELKFFLREMQRKDLITYNEEKSVVQFTFAGLEYMDTVSSAGNLNISITSSTQFDIGLSFAGENRQYVEKVASKLSELGISVFYDAYEQANLWGKDLYQHLNDVYKNKCQYCIVFISKWYAEKLWTKHELKAAQTRAFNENKEYILPVKFDDTEVPGVNSTVGYIDCNKVSAEQLALLAAQKLRQ